MSHPGGPPGTGRASAGTSDSIFLVSDDGSLTEATSTAYNVEAELQELLARNVDLLPGAQINRDSPRRWLLVKREAGSRK
jgi:predicted nucleotidyltransferase